MDSLQTLADKQAIAEVVTDLFLATDRKDWTGVLACFDDEVLLDMSSLGGPAAARVPAREIAAGWERGLAPIQAVHHQVGNLRAWPTGDVAEASCYGVAWHYRPHASGRNTRTFVGSYDLGLRRIAGRWRIDRFTFHAKFVEGNLELEKDPVEGGTAAERTSDG